MFSDRCVLKWVKERNWNNQIIDVPEIKPEMKNSKVCKFSILWGNEQSEELKKMQYALVETWH